MECNLKPINQLNNYDLIDTLICRSSGYSCPEHEVYGLAEVYEEMILRLARLDKATEIIQGFMISDDNCGVDGCTKTNLGGFLGMPCREHMGEEPMFEQDEEFAKIVHLAREWLKQ